MTEGSVAIAGGGLAGLTAACHLAEAGVDVTLFERRGAVGGRVRTREREGFRLDRGFQVLFTAYPAVRRELDLEALDLRRFDPGATVARAGRRSVLADPFRDPGSLLASALNREVTLADKLRVLRLRREALRGDPASVEADDRSIRAALFDRGFSEAFVESFAAPFYGGITLDRSLADTSAFVFGCTFATLSRGATAVPAAGMGAIPARLAERATDRIPFAQFDQPPGFRDELPSVDAPGGSVFLAGDYTRWSSIQGAMASGRDAAGAALRSLG